MNKVKDKINKSLIGQEALVSDIVDYFEEKLKGETKGVIAILGEKDTGKKAMVKLLFKFLKEEGKMENGKVEVIDVASYNFNLGYNAFLSDLYESLNNNSEGVLFKNFSKGTEEILNTLKNVYPNSCIKLEEKYILKNNILVQDEAKDDEEINKIVCHNKFFIFVDDTEGLSISDVLGKDYANSMEKVFKAKKLTVEERYSVIRKIVEANVLKIKEEYGIELWINLNTNIDDEKYDLCTFIYESFKSEEELDIKKYIDYKILKPIRNLIKRMRIEEGSRLIVYRKEEDVYCSDGNDEYNLEEYSDATLEEAKYKLNSIIGMKDLKDFIEKVENHIKVQRIRKKLGLKETGISLNMIFAGNAGTGKTNAARVTFEYFNALGLLKNGVFREVSKSDFMSENTEDLSKVTMDIIQSALGGVLFIDEAYSLCESEDDKGGKEIVNALLKGIEDNRENLVVIMAGYEKDMEKFLTMNQGLKSRFSKTIHFYDYTPEEMYEIALKIAKGKGYRINPEIKNDIIELFYKNQISGKNDLGNARFVRNIVENAIMDASKKYITGEGKGLDILDFENFNFKVKTKFDLEKKLGEIIGLERVKNLLRDQYKLIIAQEKRKSVGVYTQINQNLNMVFAGNPGTGKTSIARLVAEMLNSIGLLKQGQLVETDRSSFISTEKGGTAKKTEEVFKKAIGGVLFIDEAYTLANDTLGIEAIETLLKLIEDYGDQVVVILAGYEKELEDFFDVNIGLKSRFPLWTKFEDYNPEELLLMAVMLIEKKGFNLSKNGYFALKKSFVNIYEESDAQSGNGRMVRNYVEGLIRSQSIRISENDISTYDMNLITAKDIENSDVKIQVGIDLDEILEGLVLREKAKSKIKNIYDFLKLKEFRRKRGIDVHVDKGLNILIAGNDGTGKEKISEIISGLLFHLGLTKTRNITKFRGFEILNRYKKGESIEEIFYKSLGKTIYIDDLNNLYKESNYLMEEFISFMKKYKGKIVFILSDKKEVMQDIIRENIGFGENFLEYIKLDDYTYKGLREITVDKLSRRGFTLDNVEIQIVEDTIKEFLEDTEITIKNGVLVENYIQILSKVQGSRVSQEKLSNYLNAKVEKIDLLEAKEEFKMKFKIKQKVVDKKVDLEALLKIKEMFSEGLITKEEFLKIKSSMF